MANDKEHNLQHLLAESVASAVTRHTSSPEFRGELIGEILTHAGHNLIASAGNYITIRPEDVLVPPEPVGETGDAVVLTKTIIRTANSYTLVVLIDEVGEGELSHKCIFYTPNELNTLQTNFIKIPEAHLAEVQRQLKSLCKKPGSVMFNFSVIPGHFKKLKEAQEQAVVQLEQQAKDNKAEALAQAQDSLLPAPDAELL